MYAVTFYSPGAWLITDVLPVNVSIFSPFSGTVLEFCAGFGVLISGIGSGLTIRNGGAIDGMEVMAVIFAKKLNMTVGTFVMVYHVIHHIAAGMLSGSLILPLYSIVAPADKAWCRKLPANAKLWSGAIGRLLLLRQIGKSPPLHACLPPGNCAHGTCALFEPMPIVIPPSMVSIDRILNPRKQKEPEI